MSSWARADVRNAFAAQLADRARAVDAGDTAIGWKIGVSSPAAMAAAGIDAPLVGYLLGSGRIPSHAEIPVAGWTDPRLEPEIAVWLGADVPAGATDEQASAAIESISLAFELVDLDGSLTDAAAAVRHNVFQRGVVLGERAAATPTPPPVTVLIDGEVYAVVADPTATTGAYAGLVRHVADVLGAAGGTLRTGEVIITGILTAAIPLVPGRYAMRAAALGEIELAVTR